MGNIFKLGVKPKNVVENIGKEWIEWFNGNYTRMNEQVFMMGKARADGLQAEGIYRQLVLDRGVKAKEFNEVHKIVDGDRVDLGKGVIERAEVERIVKP